MRVRASPRVSLREIERLLHERFMHGLMNGGESGAQRSLAQINDDKVELKLRNGHVLAKLPVGDAINAVLAAWLSERIADIRSVHPAPCRMELNVNRNNRALHFYERMGMRKLREGDFPIGDGYYMNDYIMGLDIK